MVIHRVLTSPECGQVLPFAQNRARELYKALEVAGRNRGEKRTEVKIGRQGFYIDIRVAMPQVWILIDTKGCPTYLSGLAWIKSWSEPTVEVDDVEYLRTLFAKATPTTETDVSKLAPIAEQMKLLRPGMFSGEMRKVVQILTGMGKSVPYSHTASTTHGVYVTAGGARWIIKISSAGVYAYPMLTCSGKNVPEGLGYTPLPTPEPEEPIELLDAAGVRDAYNGKSAFYGACGWAFSESGAKAANCFVGSQDIYSYSWQYQISIQADPQSGEPVSATMSRLSEGYIHGPKTTHMKYPRSDIPLALYSFDPYRGNANYRNDCAAPVFCFFDGEALQTYYYVYAPSSSFSRSDTYTGDGRSAQCSELDGVPTWSGTYSETARPVIQLNNTQRFSRSRDSRALRLMYTEGPLGVGSAGGDFGGAYALAEVWFMVFEVTSPQDRISDRFDVLIVTGYEREAAYLATETSSSNTDYNYQKRHHAFPKYVLERVKGEDCWATSDLSDITFVVGGYAGQPYADDSCQSGIRYGELYGYYVFEGTGPGSNIQWREQKGFVPGWDGCLSIWRESTVFYGPNSDNVPSIEIDIPAVSSTGYKLGLTGSGGFRASVDASSAEIADWLDFIETGMNDQLAHILRDAFRPTRAAYSTAVNKPRGFELRETSDFGPYDLASVTGSTLLFVGEP